RGLDLSRAGFRITAELGSLDGGAPIAPGVWDCFLEVEADGVVRPVRLGRLAGEDLDRTARAARVVSRDPASGTELTAAPFFTGYGNLSIEVTRRFALPVAAPGAGS
ncbi:hypothetical protein ABTZ17_36735, partial [Streptomyces sp. NPDC097619]